MVKKFFLIAGEASGDLLGSKLIRELKLQLSAKNEEAEFIGIGGRLMQKEGLISIFPMEELSLMGFAEVVLHIPRLLRRIRQTAEVIIKEKPDFIITIDSPDFSFRVIAKLPLSRAKREWERVGVRGKKIHLIAPSVWAYREGRAKKISRFYDLLLVILPFEPPYFEKYGLKTVFIGHPIIEDAPDFSEKNLKNSEFRKKYSLKNDDLLICLTPGSRSGEVTKIFPEFIEAINLLAQEKSNLKVVIPLIEKTRQLVTEMAKNLKVEYFLVEKEERKSAFFATDFALAKSGTNTIELSLYRIPMIIAYKINVLTHFLVKRMVKIKFANLINLILNKELIPEMLQKNCEAKKLSLFLKKLIDDKNLAQKQIVESLPALNLMGFGSKKNPAEKAAEEILKL